jgi:hypothetical protein
MQTIAKMIQNDTGCGFRPHQRELAAQLIADGRLSQENIAKKVGVKRNTLYRWRRNPDFAWRVEDLRKENAREFADFALARKTGRAMILADIHALLWQIIEARAADPLMAGIPGGKTGLLTLKMKSVGGKIIVESRVDVKLIREIRSIVEQVRKELGQITEKSQADLEQERVRAMSDEDLNREINSLRAKARKILGVNARTAISSALNAAENQTTQ